MLITSSLQVNDTIKTIFRKGHIPHKLQTDWGNKFLNNPLSKLLKLYNIHYFVMTNEVKVVVVEWLKLKVWKYFTAHYTFCYTDALSEFIKSYNHNFHRTVCVRPVNMNSSKSVRMQKIVYGDYFKIKQAALLFRKGY